MSTAIRRLLLGDRLFSATIFSIRHERRGRLNHRQHVLLVSVPRESGTRPTEGDETRGGRGKKKSREGRPWAVTPFFALFGALPRRCVCEFLFRKRKKTTKCWKKNNQSAACVIRCSSWARWRQRGRRKSRAVNEWWCFGAWIRWSIRKWAAIFIYFKKKDFQKTWQRSMPREGIVWLSDRWQFKKTIKIKSFLELFKNIQIGMNGIK